MSFQNIFGFVPLFIFTLSFVSLTANGSGLCEVAENRRRKFRFRRHVAKANLYLLNYEKKPIKLAFADYEAQNFQLSLNPPFCKTLVSGWAYFHLLDFLYFLNIFPILL